MTTDPAHATPTDQTGRFGVGGHGSCMATSHPSPVPSFRPTAIVAGRPTEAVPA